jgi:serine protease Do
MYAPGKRPALMSRRALRIVRARAGGLLLAGTLLASSAWATFAPDAVTTNRLSGHSLAPPRRAEATAVVALPATAPKPAPAHRDQWPAAFSKPAPTSIADLKAMEQHVTNLVSRVSPAVVALEVGFGSGSGVIISEDGLVLTAGHVAGRPGRSVRITFPGGKVVHGKTLGLDADADTGLMKITEPGPWPHVPTGDMDEVKAGDWVLALGHPGGFDLQRSLVVRLGRVIRYVEGALQTDCTISPGDSGGPLFDMAGRVIGIHTAISSSMAENFHVEISEYYDTWEELARGTTVAGLVAHPRAYLGASAVDDTPGCRVTAVEQGGPAARAGLKAGDIVLKVDDRDIAASASFQRWVAEAEPGEMLKLVIRRGEETMNLSVKVEAPPRHR